MTKVIGGETEQAAEASPMGGSDGECSRKVRLARAIKCLPVCREKCHPYYPTTPVF